MQDDRVIRETLSESESSAADYLGNAADVAPPYTQGNGSAGITGMDDLSDLNLQTETVEIDPGADDTAAPPPIPDGIHEFNLLPIDRAKFGKGGHWGTQREKDSKGEQIPDGKILWLWSQAEYECVEPGQPFDKQHVFENYISTMVGRSGTSRIATLLSKLGVQVPKRAKHEDYLNLLIRESQKRPAIALETEWEARCGDCGKKMKKDYRSAKVGMRFFPDLGNGKKDPVVECQYCGSQVTARATVSHYHVSKRSGAAQAFGATL